ncbi:MAG: M23 family metallopeptidase [Oscillospiraceae bacterium]|nr:M23 family metallopeptidase [Oscillospiraceae bacterium]
MQYLKLPIDSFKPTAGYKNAKYKSSWGYSHYGVDCVSASGSRNLYGLGDGIVVAAGLDGLNGKTTGKGSGCGFCLVVVYEDCYDRISKESYNVVATYMHMKAMPLVKKGDKVTGKTLLGYYGNTGANTTGPHLHIQFDKDTKYPLYCCGLAAAGHNLLKKGTVDSTVDPVRLFHIGKGQKVTAPSSAWYDRWDFLGIPEIPTTADKIIEAIKESPVVKKVVEKSKGVTVVTYD